MKWKNFLILSLITDSFASLNNEEQKMLKILKYCQHHHAYGNGGAGYYTLYLKNEKIIGQRDPAIRLVRVPYDFKDKVVLDIGTNIGGMLFTIADKIKHGIGIDFDYRYINAANKLKTYYQKTNLDFFVFDLEKEPLTMLNNFIPNEPIDICFLLSVCMWIKNWQEVIDYTAKISHALLLETNGSQKQQTEQINYVCNFFKDIKLISDHSDDDKRNKNRKLYLCLK